MKAKEYLGQAYRLDNFIQLLQEDIEQLQELTRGVSSPGFEQRFNATRNTEAPYIKTMYMLMEKQDELNNKLKKLIQLKAEIAAVIEQVENKNEQLVLSYRYLKNLTWLEIGTLLHVDERTVRRWHGRALSHVVVPEKYIKKSKAPEMSETSDLKM